MLAIVHRTTLERLGTENKVPKLITYIVWIAFDTTKVRHKSVLNIFLFTRRRNRYNHAYNISTVLKGLPLSFGGLFIQFVSSFRSRPTHSSWSDFYTNGRGNLCPREQRGGTILNPPISVHVLYGEP